MTVAQIAVRLAELHESPGFQACRFDGGPPFGTRVAVLPSAFNPPTRAHLALLEAGRSAGVTAVAALLTTRNVDKSLFGAPLSHRVRMLLAEHRDGGDFAVLGSNAARLIDQGDALCLAFPGVEFDFIVGFDTLVRVFDSKYYEDMAGTLDRFFSRHRLIATNRAQATIEAVAAYLDEPLVRDFQGRISPVELSGHEETSSSAARDGGHDALTPAIARYIAEHGLYRAP